MQHFDSNQNVVLKGEKAVYLFPFSKPTQSYVSGLILCILIISSFQAFGRMLMHCSLQMDVLVFTYFLKCRISPAPYKGNCVSYLKQIILPLQLPGMASYHSILYSKIFSENCINLYPPQENPVFPISNLENPFPTVKHFLLPGHFQQKVTRRAEPCLQKKQQKINLILGCIEEQFA